MPELSDLSGLAFSFVMVLARAGSATMLLPGVGEAEVPGMIRAGFALALTVLFLPIAGSGLDVPLGGPIATVGMLGCEVITGLWMGWLVRVAMQVPAMAGQLMAASSGMSNVLQPDAENGPQSAALAHALALAAPVVVFASGLHAIPLRAIAASYEVIPAGHLMPVFESAEHAIGVAGRAFAAALQLGGPFVLAGLLWQVALGLLSRLVPQLQVYFAAMPGQIAGGLLLFAAIGSGVLVVWQDGMHSELLNLPGH
jgi:flagellar biosynthetic protein FliR